MMIDIFRFHWQTANLFVSILAFGNQTILIYSDDIMNLLFTHHIFCLSP